jgi:hypothetical protein
MAILGRIVHMDFQVYLFFFRFPPFPLITFDFYEANPFSSRLVLLQLQYRKETNEREEVPNELISIAQKGKCDKVKVKRKEHSFHSFHS